jgi:hypothetical protein
MMDILGGCIKDMERQEEEGSITSALCIFEQLKLARSQCTM